MNEKILTADLVNAVAELTAIPKNRCDDFVKAFFDAIANALSIDGIVKVKGLGTFKLVSVEERKSVNVQTGAEMIIPAHAKVSFTPDKVLKDEINKPYAHLKTYVLNPNAPLDPPEADDDELVDEVMNEADSEVQETASVAGDVLNAAPSTSEAATESSVNEVVEDVATTDELSVETSASKENEVSEPVTPSEPVTEEEIVTDEVSDTKKSESTENSQSSHSDWFDNWEVEYEGEGAENTVGIAENQVKEEEVVNSSPVEAADEVAASLDEDVKETPVKDVPSETTVEPANNVETVITDSEVEEQHENIAEDVNDIPQSDKKDEVEAPVNPDNSVIENTVVAATEGAIDTDDGVVEQPDETVSEKAVEKHYDEDEYSTVNRFDVEAEEQEKVQHGKVLGVGIITFLILLVAAFFGLKHLDPDFFKTLKASDNPPVMPADTTSLAQELSVYVPEKDTLAAQENQSVVEDSVSEIENTPSELAETVEVEKTNVVDPLWNGEFVAYMKRQHKDVSLATSGLIGETAIKPGLFLTMVALQNYGDKSYWIYLYLYNTDRIKNPNNVPVGTKIRVPNLDKSLVNGPSEEQVSLAKEIRQKFVK